MRTCAVSRTVRDPCTTAVQVRAFDERLRAVPTSVKLFDTVASRRSIDGSAVMTTQGVCPAERCMPRCGHRVSLRLACAAADFAKSWLYKQFGVNADVVLRVDDLESFRHLGDKDGNISLSEFLLLRALLDGASALYHAFCCCALRGTCVACSAE